MPSQRDETGWDRKDRQKSNIGKNPERIVPVRPSIAALNDWRKRARALLREHGTAKELTTNLNALSIHELEDLCADLERRADQRA
jgi:hypothetical protein